MERLEIIHCDKLSWSDEVVTTVALNNNISIDVSNSSYHKEISDTKTTGSKYELYIYRRDGSSDYTPLGVGLDTDQQLIEWYNLLSDAMLPVFLEYVNDNLKELNHE